MQSKTLLALAIAIATSGDLFAKQTLINADAMVDVANAKTIENVSVLVDGQRIVQVAQQGEIDVIDDI